MSSSDGHGHLLRLRLGTVAVAGLTPLFWISRVMHHPQDAGSPSIWMAIVLGSLAAFGFTFLPIAHAWGRFVWVAGCAAMIVGQAWLIAVQGFGVEFALAPMIIFFAIGAMATSTVESALFVATAVSASSVLFLAHGLGPSGPPFVTPLLLFTASLGGALVAWFRLHSQAALAREIVRRQGVEAELRGTQAQLESIFDATSDGLLGVHFTPQGPRITYANRQFGAIFDLDSSAAVGQYDRDVRAVAARCFRDPESFERGVQDAYTNTHATLLDELELVHPRHAILERWSGPIMDRRGMPVGRIWAFRDVTTARRIARELEEYAARVEATNAELGRVSRAKDAFLANLSHELRTPLNVVIGYIRLILEGGLSVSDERDFLERSAQSAAHLLRLISDMLDLTRLEAGTVEMTVESLPVLRVIDEVRSLTEVLAHAKGLRLDATADPAVHVFADPQRLKQILLNLVGNALKFTTNGSVSIVAAASENAVEFTVRDTGRGVPRDQQALLFQKFIQVHDHPTSSEQGVGLGLSICRELVTLMGGEIALASDGPGHGTEVRFTLPRAAPDAPARTVTLQRPTPSRPDAREQTTSPDPDVAA